MGFGDGPEHCGRPESQMKKSALQMIEDGLAARTGKGGLFDGASSIVTTIASIQSVREGFDVAAERHASAMRSIAKSLKEWDDKAALRIADYRNLKGRNGVTDGRDGAIQVRRSAQEIAQFGHDIRNERVHFVRQLFVTMKAELDASRRDMFKAEHSVKASRGLFDPVKLASSWSIGSERRSRLMQECAAMGPAALKGMAIRAAAEGDKELAGVLVSLNDKLEPRMRAFNSGELAAHVFAEKSAAANQHANHVVTMAQAALNAERALASGRVDSVAKIEAALTAQESTE